MSKPHEWSEHVELTFSDPLDADQPDIVCLSGEHVRDFMPEAQVTSYLDTIIGKIDTILVEAGIQPPTLPS